jgi:dihydroflavonol-4-reductase
MTSAAPLPASRWAITGATGLLGNNLARLLVERGARVKVLARGCDRKELRGLDVEVVQGDLADAAALAELARGAEVVVHAAALAEVQVGGRERLRAVNVEGTRSVCTAMPAGARLVHVSSVDALGMRSREHPADEDCGPMPHEGGVPYVDSKREADRVVRASGVDHVLVHPAFMVGPWDWKPSSSRMVLAIGKGLGRFPPPGGNCFVDVRDVAAAILPASQAPAGRAFVLGHENLSYFEAWTRMAAAIGAPRPWFSLPRPVTLGVAAVLDAARFAGIPEGGEINAATTRMSTLPHYFSSARALAELGLRSRSLEESTRDAWAWFGEHGYR